MIRLIKKLKTEKKKLNRLIGNNDGDLTNNFILKQSRKVDKLIIHYNKLNNIAVA